MVNINDIIYYNLILGVIIYATTSLFYQSLIFTIVLLAIVTIQIILVIAVTVFKVNQHKPLFINPKKETENATK